jgi:hypothetical protein
MSMCQLKPSIMKSPESEYTMESYVIPADILTEAACIILQAGLSYQIMDANQERQEITFRIGYAKTNKFHQQALENLYDLITDYNELRYEGNMDNWRNA